MDDAKKRASLLAKLNEAAADFETTYRRVTQAREAMAKLVHAARCEMGTAKSEHLKAGRAYNALRAKLLEGLPEVDIVWMESTLDRQRLAAEVELDDVLSVGPS